MRDAHLRGVIVATILVGLGTLARSASADCTKDTDCKGDRVCNAGQCVSPAPAPAHDSNIVPLVPLPTSPAPAPATTPPYGQPVYTQPPYGQPVYAQPAYPPPGYPPPGYAPAPRVLVTAPAWRYAHPGMRRAGIGLFITGVVVDVAGTITYVGGSAAESADCPTGNSGCQHGATAEDVGEVLWVLGGGLTLTGIILWWSGATLVPGAEPTETGWLTHVVPYLSPTKTGGRAGLSMAF